MDLSGVFMRVCPWGHHRRFEMKKNVFLLIKYGKTLDGKIDRIFGPGRFQKGRYVKNKQIKRMKNLSKQG